MSTRSLTQDEAMRELVTQTRKHLIGQEAAVTAFAAEICRHIAAGSAQPRPGIVLVAGPNIDGEHLGLPSGLAACFKSGGGLYELAASHGEDLAHIFAPIVDGTESDLCCDRRGIITTPCSYCRISTRLAPASSRPS